MYHSNIMAASTFARSSTKDARMNILVNPLDNFPYPQGKGQRQPLILPDIISTTKPVSNQVTQKNPQVTIKMPAMAMSDKVVDPRLQFAASKKHSSKLNLPVADFRYYSNKPVYQATTLPLEVKKTTRELTVFHGLLFSLILIIGTILGALAGYGLYRAFV